MTPNLSKAKPVKNGTPAKRKPGGQPGNRDAMRHGLRAGQLPKDAKFIEVRLNAVRRNLEDAVFAAKGEIGLFDAACIQTAIRWERHACLAQRWLTKQYAQLKPEQLLHFSREIARASAERDKAIAALQLETKTRQPWLGLPAPGNGDGQDEPDDQEADR